MHIKENTFEWRSFVHLHCIRSFSLAASWLFDATYQGNPLAQWKDGVILQVSDSQTAVLRIRLLPGLLWYELEMCLPLILCTFCCLLTSVNSPADRLTQNPTARIHQRCKIQTTIGRNIPIYFRKVFSPALFMIIFFEHRKCHFAKINSTSALLDLSMCVVTISKTTRPHTHN